MTWLSTISSSRYRPGFVNQTEVFFKLNTTQSQYTEIISTFETLVQGGSIQGIALVQTAVTFLQNPAHGDIGVLLF